MKNQIKLVSGLLLVVFMLGSLNADAGHRNRRHRSCGPRVVVAPPIVPMLMGVNRCLPQHHMRNCNCRRNRNTCSSNFNNNYNNNNYGYGYGYGNGYLQPRPMRRGCR